MSRHPLTQSARLQAPFSDDGPLINRLCDALDAMHAQAEANLTDLADGVTA